MKRAILFALAFTLSLSAAPNPVTTVILVRHAEKASDDDDPPLSVEGLKRANALERTLAGVKLDAIYITQYQRTRDTAAPTAQAKGLTAVVRNTGDTYATDMAKHILARHRGQTVLVVGHTSTTINVLRAFGVPNLQTMPESEYDNLFVLTDVDGAAPNLVALRYGAVAR